MCVLYYLAPAGRVAKPEYSCNINGSEMAQGIAVLKKIKLLKYEDIIDSFEASDLEICNM